MLPMRTIHANRLGLSPGGLGRTSLWLGRPRVVASRATLEQGKVVHQGSATDGSGGKQPPGTSKASLGGGGDKPPGAGKPSSGGSEDDPNDAMKAWWDITRKTFDLGPKLLLSSATAWFIAGISSTFGFYMWITKLIDDAATSPASSTDKRPASGALMSEKLAVLSRSMDGNASGLEARLGMMITNVDSKMDARITNVEIKVESQISALGLQVSELGSRVSKLDSKTGEIGNKVDVLIVGVVCAALVGGVLIFKK